MTPCIRPFRNAVPHPHLRSTQAAAWDAPLTYPSFTANRNYCALFLGQYTRMDLQFNMLMRTTIFATILTTRINDLPSQRQAHANCHEEPVGHAPKTGPFVLVMAFLLSPQNVRPTVVSFRDIHVSWSHPFNLDHKHRGWSGAPRAHVHHVD